MKRSDNKLAIDLDIVDVSRKELFGDELLYDTTIYGGKRVNNLHQKYLNVRDKYFVLAITNNMPNSKESIKNLENALSCAYIDEDGNMDDKSKGIKEYVFLLLGYVVILLIRKSQQMNRLL